MCYNIITRIFFGENKMELKGKKINFLGDSITEGVGTSSIDSVFHAVLKRECGLSEARNYGIGGTRFAVQTQNFDCYDPNSFSRRFDIMDDDEE
jgi:hypothetical protein